MQRKRTVDAILEYVVVDHPAQDQDSGDTGRLRAGTMLPEAKDISPINTTDIKHQLNLESPQMSLESMILSIISINDASTSKGSQGLSICTQTKESNKFTDSLE